MAGVFYKTTQTRQTGKRSPLLPAITKQTGLSDRGAQRIAATTRKAATIAQAAKEPLDRKHIQEAKAGKQNSDKVSPLPSRQDELSNLIACLNEWIAKSSSSYKTGVKQTLQAMKTYGVIDAATYSKLEKGIIK